MSRKKIDLDRIAFIGRTFREYFRIFDLDYGMLKGRVLDCPGGASSFAAECAKMGYDVRACDILYGIGPGRLIEKGSGDTAYALEQAYKVKDLYDWGSYGSAEEHAAERFHALKLFSEDFQGSGMGRRYIAGELPRLPFKDSSFSLALSSHFLFLYGDRMDFKFHLDCLRELLRVARHVRVYPLVGTDGKEYADMDGLLRELRASGAHARVRHTPFRFMQGADRILMLSRAGEPRS